MAKPNYTQPGRYPYHFACTKILPSPKRETISPKAPVWMREATHGCYCSAWKQQEDGTFLHWRDNEWQQPRRGAIKSKPLPSH